ncbi:MAG: glycine zipper 2TM domain-containing protein [Sphingomonas sp.]
MNSLARLTALAATIGVALAAPAIAQTAADDARFDQAQRRFQNEMRLFQDEFARYQQARVNTRRYDDRRNDDRRYDNRVQSDDRYENGYDPSRYYRDSGQERVLSSDDRVYRGSDGRYYCKRNDGTTGLIIGAVGGGILGNVIDGGHSRAVGTLIGGGLGALLGKSIDQNSSQVKCR